MDIQEGYTILLNGDGYLMKKYIDKNANGDNAMAESIVKTFRKEIQKARTLGVVMVTLGIPLILAFFLGLFGIALGIWRLSQAKRATRVLDEGYAQWLADQAA